MNKTIFYISLLFLITNKLCGQPASLINGIHNITSAKHATVGVGIFDNEGKPFLSVNGDMPFPMQSVFKLHIAIMMLSEVDKGIFSLAQKISIKKADLLPDTWSPIRKKYPSGAIMSLAELIQYTVSQSDNNGCDILLRLLGGAKKVNEYYQNMGYTDLSIQVNEQQMHSGWDVQFKNWSTPNSACILLNKFYQGDLLSKSSTSFLWKIMTTSSTGNERIKGLLPKGTNVGHKTGTSDTNEQGITAAINDIGIVLLPNGKHFIISIFVSNSKENNLVNENIIADISRLIWNYYIQNKS